MSEPPASTPPAEPELEGSERVSSESLNPGDLVTEAVVSRMARLEKYEHKLAEVARVYRNLNKARKNVETVLKKLTPVQSIADVEELEAFLSNLSTKSQYAGEQIGALTDLDKANRAKIHDLEARVTNLKAADDERRALARELETAAKERKVVEGQLERSNQKLRLDIGALEEAKAALDARLEALRSDPSALAEALVAALPGLPPADSSSKGIEVLAALQDALVDRCGVPEGLVRAAELESAVRAGELAQQEASQAKAIIRKELADAEERLQALSEQKASEVADLRDQLKRAGEQAAAPTAAVATDDLTPERVADIISAAVAHKLTLDEPPSTTEAPQAAAPKQVGKKKGSKGKRRGTQGASSSPPATAATATAPVPTLASDTSAATVATGDEVSRLVELVERIASGNSGGGDAAEAKSAGMSSQLADELRAQLAAAQAAAEAAETSGTEQAASLRAEAARLGEALDAAETESKQLRQDLDAAAAEADGLRSKLDGVETELRATKDGRDKRADELGDELSAVKEQRDRDVQGLREQVEAAESRTRKLEVELSECRVKLLEAETHLEAAQRETGELQLAAAEFGDERARLASSLAKAQATGARLEGRLKELQKQIVDLEAVCAEEKRRADSTQTALDQTSGEYTKAQRAAEVQRSATAALERQFAEAQASSEELEGHVRAMDADLATSREQFADKSRQLAQTTAQLQELQYALEKERRAAKTAGEDAAKELAAVGEQLEEMRQLAQAQGVRDRGEIEQLQRQLGDLDKRATQASQLERLQARCAEKEVELETVRASLQQTEDSATARQVEVDRLRDVERDLAAAREQLDRVVEERRLSEQRWKRVHRDLKEEVRRLHHRERSLAASAAQPVSPPTGPAGGGSGGAQPGSGLTSPTGRSNSMTMASVSSLLRAATGNAASNGMTGRRTSIHTQQQPPHGATVLPGHNKPDHAHGVQPLPVSEDTPRKAASASRAAAVAPASGVSQTARPGSTHTRSSSNAGSVSSDTQSIYDSGSYEAINVEYLRNVLFRFFNDKERRPQLVPVLSTLLNCTVDDIKQIQIQLQ
ncbi:hypothetical protein LPJ61_004952 [Coemansia biformis]|uniref:GRIP domain-containing protein n=1 Tax=Coemansia biformis TaxID=1286918 RepID=A0A9W8CW92_9FUNG|nr:hypothetical protein LPJ61_004952 [Coemansia biformis]